MITLNSTKDLKRKQRTLIKEVEFSGIGIHTGECVSLKFRPANPGRGIVFKRVDLDNMPEIPATVEYVTDTRRSTTIGVGKVQIHTVEHVLAAVRAYQVDNLEIEISNIEPPVGNGSSDIFVEMIEKSGIKEQDAEVPVAKLSKPVYYSEDDVHLVALPYDGFKVSYTLDYPNNPALKSQYQSFDITPEIFSQEIAPCRTFSLYEEVSFLMDKGLIKGGSLDNAVIVKDDAIFSKGGLFFPDEMVRHKMLDLVGDLSLVGFPIYAHIMAVKSGHAANVAFAKKIFNEITLENHQ